jgi:23S rRNA maturation-related 3'-5' exoribonuclease YhaM
VRDPILDEEIRLVEAVSAEEGTEQSDASRQSVKRIVARSADPDLDADYALNEPELLSDPMAQYVRENIPPADNATIEITRDERKSDYL